MILSKQELSLKKRGRVTPRVVVLNVLGFLLVGLSLVSTAGAQNVVRLNPSEVPIAPVSSTIALDLELQFTDVTSGGGTEVSYDASRLTFISFEFATGPNAPNASFIFGPDDHQLTQPLKVSAGWDSGVTGSRSIGTFLFGVNGAGPAEVSVAASPNVSGEPGPWYDSLPPHGILSVIFGGATTNSTLAVPSLGTPGLIVCSALLILFAIFMMSKRELLETKE